MMSNKNPLDPFFNRSELHITYHGAASAPHLTTSQALDSAGILRILKTLSEFGVQQRTTFVQRTSTTLKVETELRDTHFTTELIRDYDNIRTTELQW